MIRDLTNLPPSLERKILFRRRIKQREYYIIIPYGCQIYSKDKYNK